jgi:hypothetical protein
VHQYCSRVAVWLTDWQTDRQTDRLNDWLWLGDRLADWLWLTDWQADWLNNWQTDRQTDRLTDWMTVRLIDRLTGWLTGCDWVTDWLTDCDWLTDWLNDWLIQLNGIRLRTLLVSLLATNSPHFTNQIWWPLLLTLSHFNPMPVLQFYFIKINLILSSHLRPNYSSCLFLSGFPIKTA